MIPDGWEKVQRRAFWNTDGKVELCFAFALSKIWEVAEKFSVCCNVTVFRFDVSGVHPKSKVPGTFTQTPYCKRSTDALVSSACKSKRCFSHVRVVHYRSRSSIRQQGQFPRPLSFLCRTYSLVLVDTTRTTEVSAIRHWRKKHAGRAGPGNTKWPEWPLCHTCCTRNNGSKRSCL